MHSVLDRVDVIYNVMQLINAPLASELINGAIRRLGFVIRDADSVADLLSTLTSSGSRSTGSRRAVTVALGLLGSENAYLTVERERRSVEAYAALALAIVLLR